MLTFQFLEANNQYDVAVAGGGLAGLATAILLRDKGYRVIVFEKERYPFHKVCGEYISNESRRFLQRIGLDVDALGAAPIQKVLISSIGGRSITERLPLGGFALSRFRLDHELRNIAVGKGVIVREDTRVNDIQPEEERFTLDADAPYSARVALACYGKKANLDVKWRRRFTLKKKNRLNNFVGVKYHVRTDFKNDLIALHNFPGGYGGLVRIEEDRYCLCYLTTAGNLQKAGGIKELEQRVLSVNPYLRELFSRSEILYEAPLTISQISFDKKTQVENGVLMVGDAAGMITALCGNGMSMALHGAKIACEWVDRFLKGDISREEMERGYCRHWRKTFGTRLWFGRRIQSMFDSRLFGVLLPIFRTLPFFTRWLIRKTHGHEF